MPGKAAKITITERQHDILRTLHDAVTAPSHLRQRASLILLAFDGLRNDEIAEQVGLGQRPVGLWRRRWAKAWNRLIDLECSETHAALRRAIEAVLTDGPRPGAPGKFTPEQVTQILAVACEPPEKSGRPITHWTATNWPMRSSNGASSRRSRRPRWAATFARPPCSPTRAGIGSTPPRRSRSGFRSRSRRSATHTAWRQCWSRPRTPTPSAWTR